MVISYLFDSLLGNQKQKNIGKFSLPNKKKSIQLITRPSL